MRKLAITILMLGLGACNSSQNGSSGVVDAKSCAAPETFAAIQKVLFDDARKNYPGNVKYINDMNGLFKASVYNPVLQEINKDTNKADCQGRLTLNVPSSLSEQFGRQTSLTADVGYTVQPSADGKGFVYTVGGYTEVLQSLIDAAGLLEGSDKSAALSDNKAVTAAPSQVISPSNAHLDGRATASTDQGGTCYDLWYRRNEIFASKGYCFKSNLGVETFGNSGCVTSNPKMTPAEQQEIARIKSQEVSMSCNIK